MANEFTFTVTARIKGAPSREEALHCLTWWADGSELGNLDRDTGFVEFSIDPYNDNKEHSMIHEDKTELRDALRGQRITDVEFGGAPSEPLIDEREITLHLNNHNSVTITATTFQTIAITED